MSYTERQFSPSLSTIEPAQPYRSDKLYHVNISFPNSSSHALVDCGSAVTLCSSRLFSRLSASYIIERSHHIEQFRTATGEILSSLGCYSIPFHINQIDFRYVFHIIPNLQEECILGIDFMRQNDIILDTARDLLSHYQGDWFIPLQLTPKRASFCYSITTNDEPKFNLSHLNDDERQMIEPVLNEYKHIFTSDIKKLGCTNAIEHHIEVEGPPFARPPYRLPITLKPKVREYINDMLNSGIIQRSDSPYSSPVVIVQKNNKFRFTTDFRFLNNQIARCNQPIPRIEQSLESLAGSRYFTLIDMKAGFFQVPLTPESRKYTAFTIEGIGHFEYLRSPQGLKTSPGVFQKLMETIFARELNDYVTIYIDDLCVFSRTLPQHILNVRSVLKRLEECNLTVAADKGDFLKRELIYLGHTVNEFGIKPDKKKLTAVTEFPRPTNVKETRSFLGLVNWYRRFIIMFSEKASPLYALLEKKQTKFCWTNEAEGAFQSLKLALTSAPLLRYPLYQRKYILYVDTSSKGIGCVLSQRQPLYPDPDDNIERPDDEEYVIGYFSCHLKEKEAAYTASEKECYGLVRSIKNYNHYLFGTTFDVYVDHFALTFLQTKAVISNARLQRWSLFLQQYDFKIFYKKGSTHQNADALSRAPVNNISRDFKIDFYVKDIVDAQLNDSFCQALIREINRSPLEGTTGTIPSQKEKEGGDDLPSFHILDSGLLVNSERKIVVPKTLQKEIMVNAHDHFTQGAHFGFQKTLQGIKLKYWWKGMYDDIQQYVAACLPCARRKQKIMPKAPLQPLPTSQFIFQTCSSDIYGPLPPTRKGNCYILIFRELMTKFAFFIPMKDQKASTVVRKQIKHIFLKEGFPHRILHDGGANYVSKLNSALLKELGIKQIRTTAYHPQTNSESEILCKLITNLVTQHVHANREIWDVLIDYIAHHYNTRPHITTKEIPYYALRVRDCLTPLDLTPPNRYRSLEDDEAIDSSEAEESSFSTHYHNALTLVRANMVIAKDKQAKQYNKNIRPVSFNVEDQVLIKEGKVQTGKFFFRFSTPRIVDKKISEVNYLVRRPEDNHSTIVNVNRMVLWKAAKPEKRKNKTKNSIQSDESSDESDADDRGQHEPRFNQFDPDDDSDFYGFESDLEENNDSNTNPTISQHSFQNTENTFYRPDSSTTQKAPQALRENDTGARPKTGLSRENPLRSILKIKTLEEQTGRVLRPKIIRPLRFLLEQ